MLGRINKRLYVAVNWRTVGLLHPKDTWGRVQCGPRLICVSVSNSNDMTLLWYELFKQLQLCECHTTTQQKQSYVWCFTLVCLLSVNTFTSVKRGNYISSLDRRRGDFEPFLNGLREIKMKSKIKIKSRSTVLMNLTAASHPVNCGNLNSDKQNKVCAADSLSYFVSSSRNDCLWICSSVANIP